MAPLPPIHGCWQLLLQQLQLLQQLSLLPAQQPLQLASSLKQLSVLPSWLCQPKQHCPPGQPACPFLGLLPGSFVFWHGRQCHCHLVSICCSMAHPPSQNRPSHHHNQATALGQPFVKVQAAHLLPRYIVFFVSGRVPFVKDCVSSGPFRYKRQAN